MSTSLENKLNLKPHHILLIVNPPDGMVGQLQAELPGIPMTTDPAADHNSVLLFIHTFDDALTRVPPALNLAAPGGLMWVAYPKGTSKIKTDINRDTLWQAVLKMGWHPVRQVALDETWSAVRFKPSEPGSEPL
jgi:hypothetical protein